MKPNVSLCMIVRNEEANLADCLQPLVGLVDEIVVLDTGSTDRTKEIAARFGAHIHDFRWCDDFSAARNESIRHATGEWILWMDADDRIDEANRQKLAALFRHLKTLDPCLSIAFAMESRSTEGDAPTDLGGSTTHVRVFRNDQSVVWKGRVHEAPEGASPEVSIGLCQTDIVINHIGYRDPRLVQRKTCRDLRLMQIEYATRPDSANTLFYLGRVKLAMHQPAEALNLFRRSLRRATASEATCARKAHALTVECLLKLDRLAEALEAAEEGLSRYPDDSELLYHRGCLLSALGRYNEAEACFQRLLNVPPADYMKCGLPVGLHGVRSRFMLGLVYQQAGRLADAERQFRQILAEQPTHTDALVALGHMYVTEQRYAELETIMQRLLPLPVGQALAAGLRAQACVIQRQYSQARQLLEYALGLEPNVPWFRLTLADVMYLGGYDWPKCVKLHEELLKNYPRNSVIRSRLELMAQQKQQQQPEQQAYDVPMGLAEQVAAATSRPQGAGVIAGA